MYNIISTQLKSLLTNNFQKKKKQIDITFFMKAYQKKKKIEESFLFFMTHYELIR